MKRYIAVEGPIGVGKTTLTRRLAADLQANLLLEAPDDNPFLKGFYDDPHRYAFQVQLCFLLQRAGQIDGLRQSDLFAQPVTVADFFFDKDPLFAQMTLAASDYRLYRELFNRLAWAAPAPDVIVYLHASTDVLVQRVRQRGRDSEQSLEAAYLDQVAARYRALFADYAHPHVVVVDAEALDLVGDSVAYQAVRDAIDGPPGRWHLPG
ncbi:MAG: deoxynucleoside kinase [Abyssibacter sp.]|uniref:deoxynucleoside kinase n=1 Tax=Abyssibacter sp. TaxID=2320200 RepID=UPI003219DF36